jgi:hypothetical protein
MSGSQESVGHSAAPPAEKARENTFDASGHQPIMARTLFAFAVLAACGCTSNSTPEPSGGFQHDVVFTMSMTVPAAAELHQCQYVQVPRGPDINVNRFAHQYTTGSHHFLLYLTDLTSIPEGMTGQYDCTNGDEPILSHATGIIYGGQTPEGETAFPEDVAITVKGGQVLVMNAHYLNASAKPLIATIQVGLDVVPADQVKQQGGFFIFYDPFIDLPPDAKASSGARCYVPADVNVVSAFSHYHFRGVDMKVYEDPGGRPADKPFYTTNDWEHPQTFEGPKTWKAGDWIRYRCDYENTGSAEVFQGPSAQTSEMCVLAGLYYPKQEGRFDACEDESFIGFGKDACLSVAACIESCPASDALQFTNTGAIVGPCWERCIASGCDGATDKMLELFGCAESKCKSECSGSGNCAGCASSKCSPEFDACAKHTCG